MNYPSTQSHDPAPSEFYLPVTPSDTIKSHRTRIG